MKKLLKSLALVLALTTALTAAACAKKDGADNGGGQPAVGNGAEDGGETYVETAKGELIYNLTVVATLDPALNNSVDGYVMLCNLFEGLYRLDENDVPVPGVAESHDLSDDGLTYTFHLRDNAVWNDGKPVTAHDFEYAWKRALAPETAAEYAYLMYYVKGGEAYNGGTGSADEVGVKALDDRTLEVTLENPTLYFLKLAAFPTYYPVREDIVAADPDRWTLDPKTFISNGCYNLTQYNDKVNYVLEKNPAYWNREIVKLAKVDVRMVEDVDSAWASYLAGDFDGLYNVPTTVVQDGVADGSVQIWPYIGTYFFAINVDQPKAAAINAKAAEALQDKRVRQALSLAIDRKQITDYVRMDGSVPAYAYVPDAISDSTGKSFATKRYYDVTADIAAAKGLLADAGYPNGEGFPVLTYTYNAGAAHEGVAQALQGMWRDNLGITVELKNTDWAAFQEQRNSHDFILARHGWIADYNDASSFLEMWITNSGQNNSGYSNPEYDRLIKEAQKEQDLAKRDAIMHQAEDILMEDMPIVPIFFYTNPKAQKPYVENLRVSPLGAIYFDQVVVNK
jgi:oligopeptide transport system substrate-binding protein